MSGFPLLSQRSLVWPNQRRVQEFGCAVQAKGGKGETQFIGGGVLVDRRVRIIKFAITRASIQLLGQVCQDKFAASLLSNPFHDLRHLFHMAVCRSACIPECGTGLLRFRIPECGIGLLRFRRALSVSRSVLLCSVDVNSLDVKQQQQLTSGSDEGWQ